MFTMFKPLEQITQPMCMDCTNCKTCTNKLDKVYGNGKQGIVLLLDRPTEQEDKEGNPYCSARVSEISEQLGRLGVDVYQDCYIMYAISCWSPQNDTAVAKKDVRKAFRDFHPLTKLDRQIINCQNGIKLKLENLDYTAIVPFGKTAVKALLHDRIKGRISSVKRRDYYGENIPDQELNKWVCPTYSVSELYSSGDDFYRVMFKQWQAHLSWVVENKDKVVPKYPTAFDSSMHHITLEEGQAIEWMQEAMNTWKHVAFDYETTSLKAQHRKNGIVCVAISNGETTYGFPFYQTEDFLDTFEMLMIDPSKKIAHNVQFEHIWTRVKAGRSTYITSWHWDTMLGAHMLDNHKASQLKFQTYVNFGVIGYDDAVDKHLKNNEDKSGNAKNTIEAIPIEDTIKYCCLDSYFTAQLYFKQRVQPYFTTPLGKTTMQFALNGTTALGDAHCEGFRVSEEKLNATINTLSAKVSKMKEALQKEHPQWNGSTSGNVFGKYIYETLGCTPKIYTKDDSGKDTKQYCTDKDALKKLSHPFIEAVKPITKTDTQLNSFLLPIQRELYCNKIHPYFGIDTVKTFRSSSRAPNFQNIPKRDGESKKLVRSVIYPEKGHKLIEYDYKALEVAIAACVYQDPMLLKYVIDYQNTDMHRDVAIDIFFKDLNTFTKDERQIAKNGYVFPSFYGSAGYNCGENIWETIQSYPDILEHMQNRNITTMEAMKKHIGDYDKVFWGQRFKVYTQRKREVYEKYLKDGYIDLITGFRCQGPMGWTQAINVPVQGPASHVKLWTMIEVAKQMRKEGMQSKINCEIHDAIVASVAPDEEEYYDYLMVEYGTKKIREVWDWICVPLVVEKESTEIDMSWDTMK